MITAYTDGGARGNPGPAGYGVHILDADGNIPQDVMSDALHPSGKGYEIWAKAVPQPLTALMGTAPGPAAARTAG